MISADGFGERPNTSNLLEEQLHDHSSMIALSRQALSPGLPTDGNIGQNNEDNFMNMGYLSVKDEPYHSVGNSSDQRRKNFAANPSTSGNMTGTLGNNPKQTIGFSEGQRSLIDNIIEENTKPKATWKDPVRKFMNHWAVTLTMTIVTVYALFGDDIRVAFFTKSEDTTFNIITCVALGLFTIEITLNALTQENYFNSFYFWLDVISTLSLITDISWIWNAMIGQDEDYDASNAEQAG